MRPNLAWPLRSVLAGTAGTATMTAAYALERRLRPHLVGDLDYDDGLVPGKIVATLMHLPQVTDRGDKELGLILRWSYGSMFGLWHGLLRRVVPEPLASAAFGATLMSATFTLFPRAGSHPRAMALATGDDRDERRDARRVRAGGRRGRRPRQAGRVKRRSSRCPVSWATATPMSDPVTTSAG